MDQPLAQFLHRSLNSGAPLVTLEKAEILKTLEKEATRQHVSSRRWCLLSMILLMFIPRSDVLLKVPRTAWDWLNWLPMGMLAAACVWLPFERMSLRFSLQKRFQAALMFKAMARICFLFALVFLAILIVKKLGWMPRMHAYHLNTFWMPILSGLAVAGAFAVLIPKLARRLDPYWFE